LVLATLLSAVPPAGADWPPLLGSAQYYGAGWNASTFRYGSPFGVAVGDFIGDGRQDIVVSGAHYNYSPLGVTLLTHAVETGELFTSVLGIGGPPFATPNYGLATANLNGDARPDLVVHLQTQGFHKYYGTASGFKYYGTYATQSSGGLVATGDLDGDGLDDVVSGSGGSEASAGVEVFLSVTPDSLAPPVPYVLGDLVLPEQGAPSLALAEATGDGVLDVVLAIVGYL
jgi:hypothetical protein